MPCFSKSSLNNHQLLRTVNILNGSARCERAAYWDQYLEGYEEQTYLPKDHHAAEDGRYVPEKVACDISSDLTSKMKRTAGKHHVTLNTLLQTAWAVLLQKYNRSRDVVFGSVVSGRPAGIPNVETMIGLFINTIPVRFRCEAGTTFAGLMKEAQERAVASQQFETHPLYDIQARTTQKQDLITHLMIFENYPVDQYMESIYARTEHPSKFPTYKWKNRPTTILI